MEAYFDGLRVFQSPDNDIMVIRDERPVMHIACTKQLKKRELIQTVRELREMVIAERKARNRMNLYSAVCPICGKINQNLLLEETEGTMECESCGSADLSVKTMFVMAVATSIDALAVGISLAMAGDVNILQAVVLIGICTCGLSMAGVKIGSIFGSRFEKKAQLAGGVILILLGIKILLEHLGLLL